MTRPVSLHLVRRWWKAVRAGPLTPSDSDMVRDILTNPESDLFFRFAAHDQRHALEVLARLDVRQHEAAAFTREGLRHGTSDAASRAGDDGRGCAHPPVTIRVTSL